MDSGSKRSIFRKKKIGSRVNVLSVEWRLCLNFDNFDDTNDVSQGL